MKKMMIMVSAIMMVAAGYAKNVETKPFEGVKVNVPARVRFVNGDNYELGVRSTDSITANNIQWSVEDGVLKIHPKFADTEGDYSELCITIVSPVEPKLMVGRNFEVTTVAQNAKDSK
ncbi:MAG: DUF2807 domain-containing protein [Bacteroidaceae bacterium]|nr:DUF2807 domain-containing protein [Bacteroidaceae bacterium]